MEPTVTHRGGAQRRGSITCFSRQEGWTDFYPKRRNETRLPGPFHYQDLSGVVLTRCRLLSVYVIICLKCEFYVWKSSVLLENSICLLALHDKEDNRDHMITDLCLNFHCSRLIFIQNLSDSAASLTPVDKPH